jgi:hypothetical protein
MGRQCGRVEQTIQHQISHSGPSIRVNGSIEGNSSGGAKKKATFTENVRQLKEVSNNAQGWCIRRIEVEYPLFT